MEMSTLKSTVIPTPIKNHGLKKLLHTFNPGKKQRAQEKVSAFVLFLVANIMRWL